MTVALGCVYGLTMLFFSVAFFVGWLEAPKEIRKYLKYGVWFGAIVIGLDLVILAITPSIWSSSLILTLVVEPVRLIRLIGFTMLGMYYAADLGYPSLPILLRRFKPTLTEDSANPITPSETPVSQISEKGISPDNQISDPFSTQMENISQSEITKRPSTDLLIETNWREYFGIVFGVSILGILYSSILFLLTTPQLSEIAQQEFGVSSIGSEGVITIQNVFVLLQFAIAIAIAEEIVFRLGIQNFLAKHLKLQSENYWIAIFITSVLWSLGHAGVLEPEWVKLAQIFPVGLMLGWLYKKFGAESTMLAHGIFNLVLIFLSVYLIK